MKKAQGSVLLVTLILLLIMTAAGLTAVRMSTLEHKVSGNYLDQQMAFHAAELALLEAESHIATTQIDLTDFDSGCSGGQCFSGSEADDISSCTPGSTTSWLNEVIWETSNFHRTATIVIDGIATRAKYIIEFRCYVARETEGPLPDITNPVDWALYFRITALATGGTDSARVMLQTTYKKNT